MQKCKKCGKEFEPLKRNGVNISKFCISCLIEKGKQKQKKEWNKEKKEIKERLKTHSDWLNQLQKVFNSYIRARDKNKPCISCKRPLIGKFDAGHYYTVGAYPNLRFNENNTHGQCVSCNRDKHGNLLEYAENLPKRIGLDNFDKLKQDKNKSLKLSTEEIKELIKYYKLKLKQFINENE